MGVPTSEVGYTSAMPRREDHKVHKDMWVHWGGGGLVIYNTFEIGVYVFLFNRTTFQVFVTYLTGALYVHPLWFYKHQRDNRVRSKLFVACQRFWFVPSLPRYLREKEEHKPDPWRNPIERNHMRLHLENEEVVVETPKIISNNRVVQIQKFLVVLATGIGWHWHYFDFYLFWGGSLVFIN